MMLCVKDLWSIFDRNCVKKCGRQAIFAYINVTTGSIDKTIEIPENGDYTLAIRNNSSKSVKVTGVVRY